AVRSDGVWEYLPAEHAMKKVLEGDRRGSFDNSGLVLLYAAPVKDRFSAMHVGSMYQNVALYCASAGLENCVKDQGRGALDRELPLPAGWETLITQSVAPGK
ncbi:MAG: SagB/ThcOx family dehydrogenase, partial [Deltaproteobacteria bacterium]|nr:SagB/ThcOx family dehydrogenase [Deltaproteobacteria bacterium]